MPLSETKFHTGDLAPDFTLPDVHGKSHQLGETLKQSVVLLVFFRGTWCDECRAYLTALEAPYEHFKANGVQVLGVAHQRTDIAVSYFRREPISYPYLIDNDMKVITAYGLKRDFVIGAFALSRNGPQTSHPACLLIDQSSIIRWIYVGDSKHDLPTTEMLEVEIARLGLGETKSLIWCRLNWMLANIYVSNFHWRW